MNATNHDEATLNIAMIRDVFFGDNAQDRLTNTLKEAKAQGAALAVLPEIPLNRWAPASQDARDDDAEPPNGKRHQMQSEAASTVGIGLLGGAIITDPTTRRRHNTSLVFDTAGQHVASFRKCHVPEEPGFWETSHYDAGDELSPIVKDFGITFGIQICSDINRPQGSLALAAAGAEAVINPRATEEATVDRWRTVFKALALTSGAYIISVNRPSSEDGVLIGGENIAIDPLGNVLADTNDRIAVITVQRSVIAQAKQKYPGYLPVRSDLYAKSWEAVDPDPGYKTDW